MAGSTNIQAFEETLCDRTEVLQELKRKFAKAQETMKATADRDRISHQFVVCDLVFVKLRPHRQNSGRRIRKLSKRFYEPFKIVKVIGEVAFQLELLSTSKIHPVFHVSHLKL